MRMLEPKWGLVWPTPNMRFDFHRISTGKHTIVGSWYAVWWSTRQSQGLNEWLQELVNSPRPKWMPQGAPAQHRQATARRNLIKPRTCQYHFSLHTKSKFSPNWPELDWSKQDQERDGRGCAAISTVFAFRERSNSRGNSHSGFLTWKNKYMSQVFQEINDFLSILPFYILF